MEMQNEEIYEEQLLEKMIEDKYGLPKISFNAPAKKYVNPEDLEEDEREEDSYGWDWT